jgi:hypothetical protein
MLHLLSDWEYPHWMMMAGTILVALIYGFCISSKQVLAGQRVGGARNPPTERLKAMRNFASAGGRKAKGK